MTKMRYKKRQNVYGQKKENENFNKIRNKYYISNNKFMLHKI